MSRINSDKSVQSQPWAIAVVVSRYNASITDALLAGAIDALQARLGTEGRIETVEAPGSFELPALANAAARSGRFDGVVTLGCVIKGETRHDRYLAQAVATGLVQITIATGVPVAFGVITAESPRQARERAGGRHGNKGQEAADALLDTLEAMNQLKLGWRLVNAPANPRSSGQAARSPKDKAAPQRRPGPRNR